MGNMEYMLRLLRALEGYTVAIFIAYPWTNQSGSSACWRVTASSDIAALYHLQQVYSRIGFE